MCVVIAKPKGVQIRKKYLKNCYLSNPDGAGFMFVRDKKIVIKKGYFSFELFWFDYQIAEQENTKSPFVIHFRIATSGGVNMLNCHPFEIDEHNAFAHNGIFYNLPYTDELSDTQIFNNKILKTLPVDWMRFRGIKLLIQGFIKETCSKVVFLGDNKDVWICGEDEGDWFKGAWYSNDSHTAQKSFGYDWRKGYCYNEQETEYLGQNSLKTTTALVELDVNGVECVECKAIVSHDSINYFNDYGALCLDCQEEYKHTFGVNF